MKLMTTCSCIALVLVTGCTAVYSTGPFGTDPWAIEPSAWQGRWQQTNEEGEITIAQITVLDAAASRLQMEIVGKEEEKPLVLELRRTADAGFVSVKPEDADAGENVYLWARLDRQGNQVTVLIPDAEGFSAALGGGRLPGRSEGESIHLGKLEAEHYKLIVEDVEKTLFHRDNPLVFTRQ